jgi:hypothetical protein
LKHRTEKIARACSAIAYADSVLCDIKHKAVAQAPFELIANLADEAIKRVRGSAPTPEVKPEPKGDAQ